MDAPNWNTYLSRHQLPSLNKLDTTNVELSYFNSEDPLYLGVFESKPANYQKPQVFSRYRYGVSSNQEFITLWHISRKSLFIICRTWQRKNCGIELSLSPKFTNFQNHALFAATFLRLAETASFQKPCT